MQTLVNVTVASKEQILASVICVNLAFILFKLNAVFVIQNLRPMTLLLLQ